MKKKLEKNILLTKNYTRDSSLIIQETWLKTLDRISLKPSSAVFSSPLICLDYLHDGAVEIWENEEMIKLIKKKIVVMCKKEPDKIKEILKQCRVGAKKLKAWEFNSWTEFKSYVEAVECYMASYPIMYYLAVEQRAIPGWARIIAKQLRDKDTYFVDNNKKIIDGLLRFKPALKKYVVCVRKDEVFGKIPPLPELKKRWRGFVVTSNGNICLGSLESCVKKIDNKIVLDKVVIKKGQKVFKGRVSSKGKVIGRVKIVKSVNDIKKVKKGDIVVAPMTNFDLMSALKLAAAIITDEGGIVCHASIIARELKIPCIIDVKIATEVFKDGDLIEVDANKGIIKKI